jgi:hypothetical protein
MAAKGGRHGGQSLKGCGGGGRNGGGCGGGGRNGSFGRGGGGGRSSFQQGVFYQICGKEGHHASRCYKRFDSSYLGSS